jgi:hypothetical protein
MFLRLLIRAFCKYFSKQSNKHTCFVLFFVFFSIFPITVKLDTPSTQEAVVCFTTFHSMDSCKKGYVSDVEVVKVRQNLFHSQIPSLDPVLVTGKGTWWWLDLAFHQCRIALHFPWELLLFLLWCFWAQGMPSVGFWWHWMHHTWWWHRCTLLMTFANLGLTVALLRTEYLSFTHLIHDATCIIGSNLLHNRSPHSFCSIGDDKWILAWNWKYWSPSWSPWRSIAHPFWLLAAQQSMDGIVGRTSSLHYYYLAFVVLTYY